MPTISFKVSEKEERTIRARALREHLTVSELLQRQGVALFKPPTVIERVNCPRTGAIISGGAEDLPLLTGDYAGNVG